MLAGSQVAALSSVLLAVSLFPAVAQGCSCGPLAPPCKAVGLSQLVFIGTVTEIATQTGPFKTVRLNVDRVFKGDLKKTVELFDGGMCDGPDFEVGKQYLMYTTPWAQDKIPARGCTRSRAIEFADEDLSFLQQYSAGKGATHFYGTVRFRPDGLEDNEMGRDGRPPLRDVRVTLSSNGRRFSATTDSVGGYWFSNLAPGEYTVSAELPGYRLEWAPGTATLPANGCAVENLLMVVDRRVEGVVRDKDGTPVHGALVEMVSTKREWERSGVTDQNGEYSVDDLPPGDYYLGVNINSTPTKEHPYPSTYYPNTPDPGQATPIGVPLGASVQRFDLRVPRRLPVVTIRGRVQTADGKPPLLNDDPQFLIEGAELHDDLADRQSMEIDALGQFRYELCEGIKYSARAFSGLPTTGMTRSEPIEFTPTKENDEVVLTLDKTEKPFGEPAPK